MRDHLEHFDERLDEWALKNGNTNYVQDFIGPVGAMDWGIMDPKDAMRWYDPYRNVMRFRGEEYEIQPIVIALRDVLTRCRRFDGRPIEDE